MRALPMRVWLVVLMVVLGLGLVGCATSDGTQSPTNASDSVSQDAVTGESAQQDAPETASDPQAGAADFVGKWSTVDGMSNQLGEYEFYKDGTYSYGGLAGGKYTLGSSMDAPVVTLSGVNWFYEFDGDTLRITTVKGDFADAQNSATLTRQK